MRKDKRVVAIEDISCLGRCSLTVALPIISAAGIETVAMPTAVLSTHTGGFEGFTFRDLTEDMMPISQHWIKYGFTFDALYTGYLGSPQQIKIVEDIFDLLKTEETTIMVDPVMADNGVFYKGFDANFALAMAGLCKKADIIVPNMTEAAFILGEEYIPGPYKPEQIEALLKKLCDLGPSKAVLTGIYYDDDSLGAAAYDAEKNEMCYYANKKLPGYYHGTGDIFASVLLSALLNNKTLEESIKISVDFIIDCIISTQECDPEDMIYGVRFEKNLGKLTKLIG